MTTPNQCPECGNVFLQPFKCTTCGAQKLYDATLNHEVSRADKAEARCEALAGLLREARHITDLHNHTPDGGTRKCLDGCIACDLLARIDAALKGGEG